MLSVGLALLGAYLIGSIPTGYVLVKWVKRVDVRTLGSGNVGATNVTRVAGGGLGKLVFALDLAKGVAAVCVVAPMGIHPLSSSARLACGILAVLGHCYPIGLKFQGGKGVATMIGVVLGTMPLVAVACLGVWVACFLRWRYVSVSSLAAVVTVPLAQAAAHQPAADVLLGVALALLIVVRHRENLARLRQGREHRAGRAGASATEGR